MELVGDDLDIFTWHCFRIFRNVSRYVLETVGFNNT